MPAVPAGEEKSKLSPEDQKVMSRRNFLKMAGVAALGAVAPEVMAAPEQGKENISLNFELTPLQRESLMKNLSQRAPGARAEFTLSGPVIEPYSGEKLMRVDVIVILKDGSERRGKGVGFHNLTTNEKMAREALADAFER